YGGEFRLEGNESDQDGGSCNPDGQLGKAGEPHTDELSEHQFERTCGRKEDLGDPGLLFFDNGTHDRLAVDRQSDIDHKADDEGCDPYAGTVLFFTAFIDAAGIERDVSAKFVETGLAYFGIGEALGADGGVEGILKRIIRDYVTGLSRPEFVDGV